jgi:hypothetical protein
MAIAPTASIRGRCGLFIGQLMLHAPNYDALRRKNLLFVTPPSRRSWAWKRQQAAVSPDGSASRASSLGMFVAFYKAT